MHQVHFDTYFVCISLIYYNITHPNIQLWSDFVSLLFCHRRFGFRDMNVETVSSRAGLQCLLSIIDRYLSANI